MNVKLKIVKTQEGSDYTYDFTLWGDVDPVMGYSSIRGAQYKQFKETILYIKEPISTFLAELRRDPQGANDRYEIAITRWLRGVSRMVKKEFLPEPGTDFANRMADLERRARSGEDVNLTMLTNAYLVPWWLTNSYTSDNPADMWNTLFSVGFIPTLIDFKGEETKAIPKPRIALISRPTEDLRDATDIGARFREIEALATVSKDDIDIQNGSKNQHPTRLGRFGLLREEIEESFGKGEILFYYGHFELDEELPGNSHLEAIFEYDVGRATVPHDEITLDSIKHLLEGKILFLDACRSIGLPFLGDEPFPPKEKTLPNFYMTNRIVCIGTIYPIFDDAAVDYMVLFIKSLLQGHCLGKAVRDARRGLMAKSEYALFDWSPYILVGNPRLRVQA